jgi:hypothetical protein
MGAVGHGLILETSTCGSNADLKHRQNIALLLPVQLLHLQQLLLHYYRQPQQR